MHISKNMSAWITGPAPNTTPVVVEPQQESVSNLPVLRAFSPDTEVGQVSIGFTSNAYFLRQQITRPLVFVIDNVGAVPFATVDLQLVADGFNPPVLSAFRRTGSSDFDGTAGTVNYVRFWFTGTEYMYSFIHSGTTVPRITSAARISDGVVQLNVTGASLSTGVVPSASAFSITNINDPAPVVISNVNVASASVTLTLSRDVLAQDIITYTTPDTSALEVSGNNRLGCVSLGIGAPVCTAAPTLSSASPITGTALTVNNGTWSTAPSSYSYVWCHADIGTQININNSYTPIAPQDRAHTLMCIVKASNSNGVTRVRTTASDIVTVYERLYGGGATTLVTIYEVVNGAGYNYGTDTDSNQYVNRYNASAVTTTVIPSSATTGSFAVTYQGHGLSVDGMFVGISHTASPGTFHMPTGSVCNADFGIYVTRSNNRYHSWNKVNPAVLVPQVNINDVLRVRKINSSQWIGEYGRVTDNVLTFTQLASWTLEGDYLTYNYNGLVTFVKPQQAMLPRTQNFV